MLVRFKALLLLSTTSAVLGTSNRCHPENGENACFDIEHPCPWNVANQEWRESLQICTDKLPVAGVKRCAAEQAFQCIDPAEEICTPTEAQLSQTAIDSLKLCTDVEHLYKRCHVRANGDRCFHPLEECVGTDRDDIDDNFICPDLTKLDIDRCHESQPYRCIDPATATFGTDNTVCPNSVIEANNLKICNDILVDPAVQPRCHPWQINPCFKPDEECGYDLQPAEARDSLGVCEDTAFDSTKLRCHKDQTVSCLDPRLSETEQSVDTCLETTNGDFANLNLCEDLAHHGQRCDPKYLGERCFHPLQACVGTDRDDIDDNFICPDLTKLDNVDRCHESQPYRCINPATATFGTDNTVCPNSVIEANNLKYCNDIVESAAKERCHPWSINSCFDPVEACPWSIRPYEERLTLQICEDISPLITNTLRCHNDNADQKCLDPEQDFQNNDVDCQVAITNHKICEDKVHLVQRCDTRIVGDRCLYPTEQCIGADRDTNLLLCDEVTDTSTLKRCDPLQQVPCWDPTEDDCADMTDLVVCNDVDPGSYDVKRCHPMQVSPCIGTDEDTVCNFEYNPQISELKICEDAKTSYPRCDPRQILPCLTFKPEANKGCTFELLGDQSLSICPEITALEGDALAAKNAATPSDAQHGALCADATADCKHPLVDATTVAACAGKDICEILFFEQDRSSEDSTFCTDIDDNSACLGLGEELGAGGAGNGGNCPSVLTDDFKRCPGYESRCAVSVSDRCFEIDPDKACFVDVDNLSRCTDENDNIEFTKKRCDSLQTTTCWDPSEPDCNEGENEHFDDTSLTNANFVYLCGDKAHLQPRYHRRQKNACLMRTEENVPNYGDVENTNSFKVEDLQALDLCPEVESAISTTHPTCDPIQGSQACIDPSPGATECTPVNSSLRYCADKVTELLGGANEVNRCDPLNINPCIDPRNHCPWEYLAQQPGISRCTDIELPTKRCQAADNTNPCYFVGADGIEETCTDAENENFATLDVCPDAAARINRCSPRQVIPCRDPTDPCSIELNPQYLTLGICSDLVSMAPSTLPSQIPSNVPSNVPSFVPSSTPSLSVAPSDKPSLSAAPSASPSDQPSASPSDSPSASPSESPSDQPSASPSDAPSAKPSTSASPSAKPSPAPSESPTVSPSSSPSASPTLSSVPSATPSFRPTVSMKPTFKGQTYEPSDTPSASPSASPSESPSSSPSASPSSSPSASPTSSPSSSPSASPTSSPSSSPSASPTGVTCVDDPDFLLDANENRNCEWVRENPDRVEIRCGKVDSVTNVAVADACPLSCNPECEDFVPTATPVTSEPTVSPETQCGEDDPTPFFVGNNAQEKNCEWVASRPNQTEKRCDKTATDGELVSTKCTFTCQLRCVCRNSKKKFRLNGERVKCRDVGRNQCDEGVRFRGRNTFVKERCPKKCNYCFDL